MLKLFKRWGGSPVRSAPRPDFEATRPDPSAYPVVRDSVAGPLPEIVAEGNDASDWSLWEDSVMALDSQMQSLMPSARVLVRDTRPSQLDEIDVFSGVGKNHR